MQIIPYSKEYLLEQLMKKALENKDKNADSSSEQYSSKLPISKKTLNDLGKISNILRSPTPEPNPTSDPIPDSTPKISKTPASLPLPVRLPLPVQIPSRVDLSPSIENKEESNSIYKIPNLSLFNVKKGIMDAVTEVQKKIAEKNVSQPESTSPIIDAFKKIQESAKTPKEKAIAGAATSIVSKAINQDIDKNITETPIDQANKSELFSGTSFDKLTPERTEAVNNIDSLKKGISSNDDLSFQSITDKYIKGLEDIKTIQDRKETPQDVITKLAIAIAPSLIGKAIGGTIGGLAGAEGSKAFFDEYNSKEAEKRKNQIDLAKLKLQTAYNVGILNLKQKHDLEKIVQQRESDLALYPWKAQIQSQLFNQRIPLEALKDIIPVLKEQSGKQGVSSSGGGKSLPQTYVIRLTAYQQARKLLLDYKKMFESNKDLFGPTFLAGPNRLLHPQKEATLRSRQLEIMTTIGRTRENGVLREADEKKWTKILPGLEDYKDSFKNKIDLSLRTLADEYNILLSGIGDEYNKSKFSSIESEAIPEDIVKNKNTAQEASKPQSQFKDPFKSMSRQQAEEYKKASPEQRRQILKAFEGK